MTMFSESTHLYDFIYGELKDYVGEAAKIAQILGRFAPGARRLLDVGCGTGRHASLLAAEHGYEVDGLDVEAGFLDIARERCPQGSFFRGDMASFDLGRRYDAVLCLFSSIGYVKTLERVWSAARSLARHLERGGVAVIEPWFAPDDFHAGSLYVHTVDRPDLKICRMSRSEVRGRISWLEFHYLVGDARGIRHLREEHELGLFTKEEMIGALETAGFAEVEFDPQGLTGRGLYVARSGQP